MNTSAANCSLGCLSPIPFTQSFLPLAPPASADQSLTVEKGAQVVPLCNLRPSPCPSPPPPPHSPNVPSGTVFVLASSFSYPASTSLQFHRSSAFLPSPSAIALPGPSPPFVAPPRCRAPQQGPLQPLQGSVPEHFHSVLFLGQQLPLKITLQKEEKQSAEQSVEEQHKEGDKVAEGRVLVEESGLEGVGWVGQSEREGKGKKTLAKQLLDTSRRGSECRTLAGLGGGRSVCAAH